MQTGIIFDIKSYALHDGPGIRTTVFLKGCPLSCEWCHNPEGQSHLPEIIHWASRCIHCGDCVENCPEKAIQIIDEIPIRNVDLCNQCGKCVDICPTGAWEIAGKMMTTNQVLERLRKDIIYFDESGGGVTFSGGEPMLQIDFLTSLLAACKREGIHTAVDTSGIAPLEHYASINSMVDLYLYDIKLMDDCRHHSYTGVSNQRILKNIAALSKAGKEIIVRIPIIPGVNDDVDNLTATTNFLLNHTNVRRIDILPYHHIATPKYARLGMAYSLADLVSPSDEAMNDIVKLLMQQNFSVKIGG